MELGYSKDLLILAFDHRGSFQEKLLGIKGRQPNALETKEIAAYKGIIYDGFRKALRNGVPKEMAGILVDEGFGAEILMDAKKQGISFAMPAEKSGQEEFDFEYGEKFAAHIEKFDPTFCKVLVRYNTEADRVSNERQLKRLKRLSDYLHSRNRKFLFELLVPATEKQLQEVGGDKARFDSEKRPKLMVQAMNEIQKKGIEPDVWKLEGLEKKVDVEKVCAQARNSGKRKGVGVVVLGRGESEEKVKTWLQAGAKMEGVIGFAVGRTIFWDALKGLREGKWNAEKAAGMVAFNYRMFVDLWLNAKK